MDVVWGQSHVSETSLTEAISLLRQSLGDNPQDPSYIQTVHRRGYRFVADMKVGVPEENVPKPTLNVGRRPIWPALTVGISLAAAVWVGYSLRRPPLETAGYPTKFTVPLPADHFVVSYRPSLAISPDGRNLIFAARHGSTAWLFRRSMDSLETIRLEGTQGAYGPFLSPDGGWVGFFADGRLKRVAIAGGPVFEVCDAPKSVGGSWGTDDRIIFGSDVGGLWRIPAEGGRPEVLTRPQYNRGELGHCWPEILPGGKHVLFTIWTTTMQSAKIAALNLGSGEIRELVDEAIFARYSGTGHLLYSRAKALVSVPFDPDNLQIRDTPTVLLDEVSSRPERGMVQFAVSNNGTLIYLPRDSDTARREIVKLTLDGAMTPLPIEHRFFRNLNVSHNARQVAVTILDGPRSDVWVGELDRPALRRLTFEGFNIEPVWSRDGRWVAFASNRSGAINIYTKTADGMGEARRFLESQLHQYPDSWAPDGRSLLFTEYRTETGFDLWSVDVNDEGSPSSKPRPFMNTTADELDADFSPDGRWVTYSSNETGRWEIYVRDFPGGGGKWQVSSDGGGAPFWSADGKQIFYQNGDSLFQAPIELDPEIRIGNPEVVVKRDDFARIESHPDSGKLIAIREVGGSFSTQSIHVVINFNITSGEK
jgi:serine/threonine-protein kinase